MGKAKDIITAYSSSRIFFDRDKSGIKATLELMQHHSSVSDGSHLYKNAKDLNEWLVTFGLPSTQSFRKSTKPTQ